MRNLVAYPIVGLLLLIACNTSEAPPEPAVTLPERPRGGSQSFNPADFPKSCFDVLDCVLLTKVTSCSSDCCPEVVAVRRTEEVFKAQRETKDACGISSGGFGSGSGGDDCEDCVVLTRAVCVDSVCVGCPEAFDTEPCSNEITVNIAIGEPGHYAIDIDLEGVSIPRCEFDVPSQDTDSCKLSRTDKTLTVLDPTNTAKAIGIEMTRDGVSSGKTMTTLKLAPKPGSNGCPTECSSANVSYP